MLELRGAPAFSEFRLNKIIAKLQQQVPAVTGVYAEFKHFANTSADLNDEQLEVLGRILKYGPKAEVKDPSGSNLLLVVPRLGTISPWSSKATDIVRNCGLTQIERIERGTAFYIEGDLSADDLQQVAALIHDRMVEALY